MGYTGGSSKNPTYKRMGNHSETVALEYDPSRISYETLLKQFWIGHNPTRWHWSRQYMSAIFYHDAHQQKLAEETQVAEAAKRGAKIHTKILPATSFYRAEDYHQKYALRQSAPLMKEFGRMYPSAKAFTDSTAAARINGYLGGFGDLEKLNAGIDGFGLSLEAQEQLKRKVSARM